MLQHQERQPQRATIPAPTQSAQSASPSQDPTSVPSPDHAALPAASAGFDFVSIAILPPEPPVGPAGGALGPATADRIRAQQGGGAPLDPPVQRRMEGAFGHNFADVRIHADGESDILNRSLSARAFTLGSDIFLGQEATSARADGGDRLLAHELTHVVQQRGVSPEGPARVGAVDDPAEREAAALAEAVGAGSAAHTPGPVQTVQRGVAPARVQRDPQTATQDPGTVATDVAGLKNTISGLQTNVAGLKNTVAVLQKKQAVDEKKLALDELDTEWHRLFDEKLASYQQAIWRVTGGIEAANLGFQAAQAAQARANQIWAQLFGLGASFLFAGIFEWVAMKALGPLGKRLNMAPKDIVEKIENPANTLVGGLLTNVRLTYIANRDAEGGQAPTIFGKESAMGFLSTQQDALQGHAAAINGAFSARTQKMKHLSDDAVLAFDVEVMREYYKFMFQKLALAGGDATLLEPPDKIGRIIERHLWAAWIMGEHQAETKKTADRPAAKRFNPMTPEGMDAVNPDALSDFGAAINQRLNDLDVDALSGAPLQTHWWEDNGSGWEMKLTHWARTYNESIAK